MIWLVWRQHRVELVALLVGGLAIATALVVGAQVALEVQRQLGVDTCTPLPNTNANCVSLAVRAGEQLQPFRWLLVVVVFMPALVGSFVGGPLFARELERGTHRLVWTQAIARLRWAAAHLAAVLGATFVAAAAVGLVGGLSTTINGGGPNAYAAFDLEGPAFVSHVLFAVAVAALVGTLSRRILTGMLGGLLLFGAIQLGVQFAVRPYYEPPVAVVYSAATLTPNLAVPEGAWQLGFDYVDRTGAVVPQERVHALAGAYAPGPGNIASLDFLAAHDVYQRVRYQPADRYWRFQWTEGALFLGLSAAACAATLVLLRRRDA